MPISMECPSCMNSFSLPNELAGRKTKCPECQFVLYVPHGDWLYRGRDCFPFLGSKQRRI